MVDMQGRESGGSWFETCLGVWYPRRRPCGVAINTLVDLINWLGNPQVYAGIQVVQYKTVFHNNIKHFAIPYCTVFCENFSLFLMKDLTIFHTIFF